MIHVLTGSAIGVTWGPSKPISCRANFEKRKTPFIGKGTVMGSIVIRSDPAVCKAINRYTHTFN